jgi:hypothetical protein
MAFLTWVNCEQLNRTAWWYLTALDTSRKGVRIRKMVPVISTGQSQFGDMCRMEISLCEILVSQRLKKTLALPTAASSAYNEQKYSYFATT